MVTKSRTREDVRADILEFLLKYGSGWVKIPEMYNNEGKLIYDHASVGFDHLFKLYMSGYLTYKNVDHGLEYQLTDKAMKLIEKEIV